MKPADGIPNRGASGNQGDGLANQGSGTDQNYMIGRYTEKTDPSGAKTNFESVAYFEGYKEGVDNANRDIDATKRDTKNRRLALKSALASGYCTALSEGSALDQYMTAAVKFLAFLNAK